MEWSEDHWLARSRITYGARPVNHSFAWAPIRMSPMYGRATLLHRSNRHLAGTLDTPGSSRVQAREVENHLALCYDQRKQIPADPIRLTGEWRAR
jgi:hypothetical protein